MRFCEQGFRLDFSLPFFCWRLWNLTPFKCHLDAWTAFLSSLQTPACLSSEPSPRWPSRPCSAAPAAAASRWRWPCATSASHLDRWRQTPASTPCPSQRRTTPRCSSQVAVVLFVSSSKVQILFLFMIKLHFEAGLQVAKGLFLDQNQTTLFKPQSQFWMCSTDLQVFNQK